jgi:hypothetical protein
MFVPSVWCRAAGTAWFALSSVLLSGTAHAQNVDRDLRSPVLWAAAADSSGGDLGYRDGYHQQPYRDKDRSNQAYSKRFQAGEAQRLQNVGSVASPVAAAGTADYENGFRDALNKQPSRDRDRNNKNYSAGYKAGGARSAVNAANGADYELGFRDAFNKAAYRERDRGNKRYAEGFKAGQSERDAMVRAGTRPASPPLAATRPPPKRPSDLVGRNAAELESGMKALGYTRLSGFKKGETAVSTWGGNGGCVRATERAGKIIEADDMGDRAESSVCR